MFEFVFKQDALAHLLPYIFLAVWGGVGFFAFKKWRIVRRFPGYRKQCRSLGLEILRGFCLACAATLAVAVFLQPKERVLETYFIKEGITVIGSIDCSVSMLAPLEMSSAKTRLDLVLESIHAVFSSLPHDKKGFACFGKEVFGSRSATTDYERILKPQLDKIDWRYVAAYGKGTNFASGLDGCFRLFDLEYQARNICIILSDGESQGNEELQRRFLEERVGEILHILRFNKAFARFYIIGVGDPNKKMYIPTRDARGNFSGFLVDEDGNMIETKPDERYLRDIADAMNGEFIRLNTPEDLEGVLQTIINNERTYLETKQIPVWKDASESFLITIGCLIFAWIVMPRRLSPLLTHLKKFIFSRTA